MSVVLPIPASPSTTTSCRVPLRTVASAAVNSVNARSRPTPRGRGNRSLVSKRGRAAVVRRRRLRQKSEPTPVQGLDEPRGPRVVVERAPQLPDAGRERRIAHGNARPHLIEDFVLGDEVPGTLCQKAEHAQRLLRDVDFPRAAGQPVGRMQAIAAEPDHGSAGRAHERPILIPWFSSDLARSGATECAGRARPTARRLSPGGPLMSHPRPLSRAIALATLLTMGSATLASGQPPTSDVVREWNAIMVATVSGQNPFAQGRFAAITQLAVFDAVNAIERRHVPYLPGTVAPPGASAAAAAVAAAHKTLVTYFPAVAPTLDAARAESLARIPTAPPNRRHHGWRVGRRSHHRAPGRRRIGAAAVSSASVGRAG